MRTVEESCTAKRVLHLRIRYLRRRLKLTQDELAKRLGLNSKSAVCLWESGSTSPRADMLPPLAIELGVKVGDLFEGPTEEEAA